MNQQQNWNMGNQMQFQMPNNVYYNNRHQMRNDYHGNGYGCGHNQMKFTSRYEIQIKNDKKFNVS